MNPARCGIILLTVSIQNLNNSTLDRENQVKGEENSNARGRKANDADPAFVKDPGTNNQNRDYKIKPDSDVCRINIVTIYLSIRPLGEMAGDHIGFYWFQFSHVAAGAFNNLYDRDIDSIMERTKSRPTVTGEIKPKQVLWLGIFMSVFGIIALAFTTPLGAFLGFLGLFFYVVPYTMWTKRKTVYNTEVGSINERGQAGITFTGQMDI